MPTSTFYNLSEDKRDKILGAIKDEFARVQFHEVSINKIIQAAEISRGSFYQYFVDKNDMLEYLLSDYKEQMMFKIKESLMQSNGDIFTMFRDLLGFTINFATGEKTNSFCKNLFTDIRINEDYRLKLSFESTGAKVLEILKPYINIDMLNIKGQDDLINMLEILMSTCRDATAEVFFHIANSESVKQKYFKKLELLKVGFVKKRE